MKKLNSNEYYECRYSDTELKLTECCGIEELYVLSEDTNATIAYVDSGSERRAMIIFHDAVKYGNGARLAKMIRKKKLGTVRCSEAVHNPNSKNVIRLWIWVPDWLAVSNYAETLMEVECNCDY